ncbi:hypothetical protein [Calothrix sp. CCY 0018]|uniref:hypothetical protein n=1 Tax=Calothrix sp. CCY 0018 TaxID=3103864 RepID=UPI0039C637D6
MLRSKGYGWDKGSTEEKRALKLAEHFEDFAHRPHALIQISVTTLLRLCSEKYRLIIDELKQIDEDDLTSTYVLDLIKQKQAQLKLEKESQLPEKPSIWKRNCRGERYVQFPPVYEQDQQTGVLTQKLMDEYGLIPQNILRRAIADLYQKIEDEKGQPEENAAQEVDVRENSGNDNYNQPSQPNPVQTVEEKWIELNEQLKKDTQTLGEISGETGNLIVENCQRWEAAVPQEKKWDAVSHVVGHNETSFEHLSNYAHGNQTEWRKSWGTTLATYHDFERELEWVGTTIRDDALIAMGYRISATVEVKTSEFKDRRGKIIELHGNNATPILVKFDDSQSYFHWNNLQIVKEAETFTHCTTVKDIQQEEYLEQQIESDTEVKPTLLDKAIETLIHGDWGNIRNLFNKHPEIKGNAWKALSATQRKRVLDITPQTTKLLAKAKREGVIQEFKEIAAGMYQIKLPGALLWEQKAFHEIEIIHYLRARQQQLVNNTKS